MLVFWFLFYWISNTIIMFIVGSIVPNEVVLGNQHVTPLMASLFGGYLLATINTTVRPSLAAIAGTKTVHLASLLTLVNVIAIWLITRLALIVGIGIAAFWWSIVLGVTVTAGQWFAWAAGSRMLGSGD